jgi:hypothetical protein
MKQTNNEKPQPINQSVQSNQEAHGEPYPMKIPEPQGDLADRAEVEIEQEIEELIWRVQQKLKRDTYGEGH